MKTSVVVYTMSNCPFCLRAKALLTQKGVPFNEILLKEEDDAAWEALEKKSGMSTMPQVFHNDRLIGGYTELAKLAEKEPNLTSLKA